jgi:hypothetical protein
MNLDVEIADHIYTTDFFQISAFNPSHQIISIYYFARALEPITCAIRTAVFDFDSNQLEMYNRTGETETFRFIDWEKLSPECVTLPIDKLVVQMLLNDYPKKNVNS